MSNFDELTKGVGKAIQTVPELYNDALKPSAKEVGKTSSLLLRTINAALSPLEIWVLNKEYNVAEIKKLLALKLENVSPDKIVSPKPYVAVPAIQAISYSMDSEDLRDLYANLLSKAMISDTQEEVHPSFVEIIKQLSPIDAKVFKEIASQCTFPVATLTVSEYESTNPMDRLDGAIKSYSYHNLTNIRFSDYSSVLLSLDNLLRLRLVEERIPGGMENIPDCIKSTPLYTRLNASLEKYMINDRWISENTYVLLVLSDLGKLFFNICVK